MTALCSIYSLFTCNRFINPESKVHGANMGRIWGRRGPAGPHVGLMNFVIWEVNWSRFVENDPGFN